MCVESVNILKFYNGKSKEFKDKVITDIPFTIYINSKEYVTLITLPIALEELTVGFLKTNGVINTKKDINSLSIDEKNFTARVFIRDLSHLHREKRVLSSGCGNSATLYMKHEFNPLLGDLYIDPSMISCLMRRFQSNTSLFRETGGVHAASLFSMDKLLFFFEDIGRHNAVDKVIGKALIDNIDTTNKILLTTGRISNEIIEKVIHARIPVVISRSAPTLFSIKQARQMNITLIGFARGERFNVYAGEKRLRRA